MIITKKQNLWKIIDQLQVYTNSQRFMVLKGDNQYYQDYFFVIHESTKPFNNAKYTVVHKKGRCFYTINALNQLIKELNHGILDTEYQINWDDYQNTMLFIGKQKELVKMNTEIYKIIKNKKMGDSKELNQA